MCGRFSQHWSLDELSRQWPVDWRLDLFERRYNVAPSMPILTVVHDAGDRPVGGLMTWGIPTPRLFLINARAETAASRPAFSSLVKTGRLVVPMNGYYEWHQNTKQPYYIREAGHAVSWALGLYKMTPDGPRAVILTRAAPGPLAAIHPRMPVLASRAAAEKWLEQRRPQYQDVLTALQATDPPMACHAVSKRVNKAAHDGPDLIEPLAE